MNCPNCGGDILGDGYTLPRHCEFVMSSIDREPDSHVELCNFNTLKDEDDEQKTKKEVPIQRQLS